MLSSSPAKKSRSFKNAADSCLTQREREEGLGRICSWLQLWASDHHLLAILLGNLHLCGNGDRIVEGQRCHAHRDATMLADLWSIQFDNQV